MEGVTFFEEFEKSRQEMNMQFHRYSLNTNPFTPFAPETVKQSLVNRKIERKQFIMNFNRMINGEISHIFLRAKRGFGKSHFLLFLFQEVGGCYEKIEINEPKYFDSPSATKKWLDEKKDFKEVQYLFIDDASLFSSGPANMFDSEDVEYIRTIYKNPMIRTVNAWQESVDIALPFSIKPSDITEAFEDIQLGPLSSKDEIGLLKRRIEIQAIEDKAKDYFEESFFKELCTISHGNPRLLLKNASQCFLENLGKTERFSSKMVADYAERHGKKTTLQMQEALDKLTPSQKRILVAIVAIGKAKNKKECSTREMAKLLGISKPAVINQMHVLLEANFIVVREVSGLKKLYALHPDFGEFIEERFKDDIKIYLEKQQTLISKVIKENII